MKWFKDGKHTAAHSCRAWNVRLAGREAFTASVKGYNRGPILGKSYFAHRVIWLIQAGEWPAETIDHINGVRSDNRWVNLRDVSRVDNLRNSKRSIKNTSGVTGVYWVSCNKKWVAKICVNSRDKHLGYFTNKKAAIAARKAAERELGYHKNHGRSA